MTKEDQDLKALAERWDVDNSDIPESIQTLARGVLRLLAQVEARGEGWQPIETAPEGTMVLMCSMSADIPAVRWCFVDWIVGTRLCANPTWAATHWMPLPAPPKPAQAD